jgi:hypothetical protein
MPTTDKPPKKSGFSFQGYDAAAYKQTEAYVQAVDLLYSQALNDFASIAGKITVNPDKPFSFADYPSAKNAAEKILTNLASNIQSVITKGSRDQWLYACKKNDTFLASILNTSAVPKETLAKYQDKNLDALKTFQSRKVDGLGLSDRIWNYTDQFKAQMELGIDIGLGDGRSAQALSKDLRQYLVDPDKLFRRVRDKHGNLVLSKNAEAFHPGQGKYRSSYKNVMRLTRSEVNMAYRESDQLRWQNLDFVVGFEVKLSNNHTLNGLPFVDICDALKGKYPKTFKFKGWHSQCRCHVIPIMMDRDEFNTDELNELKSAINGTEYNKYVSNNTVTDVPQGFRDWIDDHAETSKGWKSQPYFIRDNFKGGNIAGGLSLVKTEIYQSVAPKVVKSIVKNITTIKTATSVPEAKMIAKNIIESNSSLRIGEITFSRDMPIERLNAVNEQIGSLFNEYEVSKVYSPNTKAKLRLQSSGSYYGRVSGALDNTILKEINFGSKYDSRRVTYTSKYRPKSRVDLENLPISTVTHEFAHVITVDRQQVRYGMDARLSDFMPELRSIRARYTKEVNELVKSGNADKLNEIYLGDYASTNINEFMAEAFTEYKLCKQPSRYAKEVGELIDKVFKRKKE